ncbi:rhamnogalacturonan lyase [Paenibacillus pasadenensis]|uniref:Putative rhamnogalacturonan lyase in rhamnose utilization cluster n=1 Tax=Paenibacillus pasadenensis TaxID=217090 RepID=A0A2N5N3F0_9BACL|nr:rhamnogalacturonan lyase [Paenibacillus pasadenensis]PLT44863.1 putative rhamnogalacturonan lyase in rhamnose utilization cluster [Paenibacillus pasadenensis]
MTKRFKPGRRAAAIGLAATMLATGAASGAGASAQPSAAASASATAGKSHSPAKASYQMEYLDRGLVAAATSEGVFLSWRLLAGEEGAARAGKDAGTTFQVYRDGRKLAEVKDSTNYVDRGGSGSSAYRVVAVRGGKERNESASVRPWTNAYLDLKLRKPADGVTPVGEAYTYSANDMSVGDVDGDGQYEFFVKWDPSNSKDVSQIGYTGNVYIDCYRLDGTLLYRYDLGVNIRAGAHYTQFLVYDFDGDGKSEIMFKTAPGTKVTTYAPDGSVRKEAYVTMPKADVSAGYSHQDDYRLSKQGYYDHVVKLFREWHQQPEVKDGSWPATLEEAFGIEPKFSYPLSLEDARELADYFMDVYAPARSARNNLRAFEGFIVDGPEYLSVFDGRTGAELQTIPYKPGREDDGLRWGDYAMARIEPGNRVDRFLAGVAYLDGSKPYAVFARGYYTRSTLVSYGWDGKRLREYWYVDSGWTPMTNPFNDGPHGRDGTDPEFGSLTTQGFHSMSAADVDGDGRQEIVYGSATIDDDGSLLYSSKALMPAESAQPGETARLGHGDAMHVGDLDPQRPGLEIFTVHEGGAYAPYGYAMRDAATGSVLWGGYTGKDTGRGMVGDVDPSQPGYEAWAGVPLAPAGALWNAKGTQIGSKAPGTNMSIRWAADGTTQIVDGAIDVTPTIQDWRRGTLLTAEGTKTNNGTKGNPGLVADVFGDWREELLVRTADSSAIRIYLSTELASRKLVTPMLDPQYRAEVARQNTTYNQPSYPSYYFGSDMDWSAVKSASIRQPGLLAQLGRQLQHYAGAGELSGPIVKQLEASWEQAWRHDEAGRAEQAAKALEKFRIQLEKRGSKDKVSRAAGLNLGDLAEQQLEQWKKR